MVALLIVCIGKAQNPEWIGYTNGDAVLAIVEDNSFLWIGTNGGLVKLDKKQLLQQTQILNETLFCIFDFIKSAIIL